MDHKATEQMLLDLVREAHERSKRALHEVEVYQQALDTFRASAQLPPVAVEQSADQALIQRMKGASYREMLRIWAEAHDGHVVVKDLVQAAFATGRLESRQRAHRTLWSTVSQAAKKGEFERIAEGEYQARPFALTDEQRAERVAEGEAFRAAHGLPLPDEGSPTLFIEPNMAPKRRAI